MASDNKKTKPAPKNEPAAKSETAPKSGTSATDKSAAGADTSKAKGAEAGSAAPASYSRGEGQKPVTQAYKDNWNAIFAKKKKKR